MQDNVISVFIDESGDWGSYRQHSPYYIVALVFHSQTTDISCSVQQLKQYVCSISSKDTIHTGPIIRGETVYKKIPLGIRQKLFNAICNFTRKVDVTYSCVKLKKTDCADSFDMSATLSNLIARTLRSNYDMLLSADKIIVYYDHGQIELNKIIYSVFAALFSCVEFRKIEPLRYTLSQVADLVCTIELLAEKANSNSLTKSELIFFGNTRNFKKTYLDKLRKKRL
ncbi:MAG: DUF3800 domain-containing protein [Synergistaceae bacterium]|nr:DUF3800 domain-containing protein [Candidatus Equadaptatus faecalis]